MQMKCHATAWSSPRQEHTKNLGCKRGIAEKSWQPAHVWEIAWHQRDRDEGAEDFCSSKILPRELMENPSQPSSKTDQRNIL
jgi:hypothetical protein